MGRFAYQRLARWYSRKYKWSPAGVLQRRKPREPGNQRLFAVWHSKDGLKRVPLYALIRGIEFREYYPRIKGNPFLEE